LFPNSQHTEAYFTVDKDFFERTKATPVGVHISFALAVFREKNTSRVVASGGKFSVPGEGQCSIQAMGENACIFPLTTPFLLVSARSEEITCAPRGKQPQLPPGITGYGYIGYRNSSRAAFGISPIQLSRLDVWDWGQPDEPNARPGLCPGTPLSFGILEEVQGIRSELQIDGIRLADYELRNPASGATGAGTGIMIGMH
jgi:hypothetical protein